MHPLYLGGMAKQYTLLYLGSTGHHGVPYTFNCTKYVAYFYYLEFFVQSYMITSLLFMSNNFTQLIQMFFSWEKIFNFYIILRI